jgi:hypothetical protein
VTEERRRSERLAIPFHAALRRRGRHGAKVAAPAVMADISGGGARMHSGDAFVPGERVLVLFRLSRSGRSGPRIAARAEVLRSGRSAAGGCDIAVRFTSHRFLDPSGA